MDQYERIHMQNIVAVLVTQHAMRLGVNQTTFNQITHKDYKMNCSWLIVILHVIIVEVYSPKCIMQKSMMCIKTF